MAKLPHEEGVRDRNRAETEAAHPARSETMDGQLRFRSIPVANTLIVTSVPVPGYSTRKYKPLFRVTFMVLVTLYGCA
eukprot:gene7086-biopygen13987